MVHRTFDRLESGNERNSEMFEAVMQQHGDGLKGLGFFTHTGHRVGVMMNFRQLVNKKKEVNIHDDFLGMFGLLVVLWNCFFFFFWGGM